MRILYRVPVVTQKGVFLREETVGIDSCWEFKEDTGGTLWFRYGGPKGLLACISVLIELDNKPWLHVSISRRDRIPSYEELVFAKETLIGKSKKAIQVFPADEEHVNQHPFCLHLWRCLQGDPLPDFTRGNKMI